LPFDNTVNTQRTHCDADRLQAKGHPLVGRW
jgi:hypothetical protein